MAFMGPAVTQEPELFRNCLLSKIRNEEVSKVPLGFHFKGQRVTFAWATWACCRRLVLSPNEEGEPVSLFFLLFSLSDSLH